MSKTEIRVLTDEQIKQKMAGYKSAYTKKMNAAKTTKERKALEDGRFSYLAERLHEIMEQNKKQIQRRAGVLSWETRRRNNATHHVANTGKQTKQTKQNSPCSCKIRIISR